ncbi:hypothetical protein NT6N_31750 [Oceaniferula spumae]|uniref:Thioredoxin domain-containing protein n=1 Tax=Oceaniferula spumae TaxID=2979115 RepID=A0AAT9FQC7_9BACT
MIFRVLMAMFMLGQLHATPLAKFHMFRLEDGKKKVVQALKPETRYVAYYFSASWCGPCRTTTPSLVAEYDRMTAQDKLTVEIVLVGSDRSEKDVIRYMENYQMRWPALEWESIPDANPYAPEGIPHLAIVDLKTGEVISKGTGPSGVEAVVMRMREFSGVNEDKPFKAGSFADRYGLLIAVVLSCLAIFLFQKRRHVRQTKAD